METRRILLYVLYGAWDTPYTDGSRVVDVSEDIEKLQKELSEIIDSKAGDYLEHPTEPTEQEIGERHYEIVDNDGRYAKFYITEHYVEISEALMEAISREMDKIDRMHDIENYLRELWEENNLENWKYEFLLNNQDIKQTILRNFENKRTATMEYAVERVIKGISLDVKVLEFLWERLECVPVDDDGCIEEDFMGYEAGTDREEIWHWFDENHSGGVAHLMGGSL